MKLTQNRPNTDLKLQKFALYSIPPSTLQVCFWLLPKPRNFSSFATIPPENWVANLTLFWHGKCVGASATDWAPKLTAVKSRGSCSSVRGDISFFWENARAQMWQTWRKELDDNKSIYKSHSGILAVFLGNFRFWL